MVRRSIRARLAALFSLGLAVLIAAAVAGMAGYSREVAERSADRTLKATARAILIESGEHYDPARLVAEAQEDLGGADISITIVDMRGRVLARSRKDAPGLRAARGPAWRSVTSKLQNGDTLVLAMPWASTRRGLHYFAVALSSLGAFVVVIAAAGAWFLVGRALRPIALLARQAQASSADTLAISLEPPSRDAEMVELVDTLNGLLGRVAATAAARGRFHAAASHELRTPLQALSGHLELALSRDRTREEYAAITGEAHAQTRRLVSLVRALLLLYQLDSANPLPAGEPASLACICEETLAQFRPSIEERRLRVEVRSAVVADVLSPPGHLDILVRNLVENAIRYADEGGLVTLAIERQDGAVYLAVSNDCSSPPDFRADDMFEPFSRPDSSRDTRTGGTGLGLAICRSIADANGWRLDLRSEAGQVRATLAIPERA